MKGGEGYDSVIRGVATSMKSVVSKRIHEEGKAADGGNIGQYDTTHPLYVNPENSPVKFQPAGKSESVYSIKTKKQSASSIKTVSTFNVKTKKKEKLSVKNGNQQRKTKYFASYKDFRSEINRPVDKVNLSLTGQMNSQFTIIPTESGYGLGWNNTEMYKRSQGLEEKYKIGIWELTDEEKKQAVEVANFEVNKIINR